MTGRGHGLERELSAEWEKSCEQRANIPNWLVARLEDAVEGVPDRIWHELDPFSNQKQPFQLVAERLFNDRAVRMVMEAAVGRALQATLQEASEKLAQRAEKLEQEAVELRGRIHAIQKEPHGD